MIAWLMFMRPMRLSIRPLWFCLTACMHAWACIAASQQTIGSRKLQQQRMCCTANRLRCLNASCSSKLAITYASQQSAQQDPYCPPVHCMCGLCRAKDESGDTLRTALLLFLSKVPTQLKPVWGVREKWGRRRGAFSMPSQSEHSRG